VRFLAVSGSLRAVSSNTALLQAAARLAPPGVEVELYGGLADLPHFNPDLEATEPAAVSDLRARVRAADGLLICSPEYAHGVPGSLKNMLDWLVGGSEFWNKPVALFNASPASTHAQAALAETIRTMAGRLVDDAAIALPLRGRDLDAAAIAADETMGATIRTALARLSAVAAQPAE
jgi:NAD(P)H-dependent FMN reductase